VLGLNGILRSVFFDVLLDLVHYMIQICLALFVEAFLLSVSAHTPSLGLVSFLHRWNGLFGSWFSVCGRLGKRSLELDWGKFKQFILLQILRCLCAKPSQLNKSLPIMLRNLFRVPFVICSAGWRLLF
jgi:hypothetical protein